MNEQEVLALKAKIEADFRKKAEAIDVVLGLLREQEQEPLPPMPPVSVGVLGQPLPPTYTLAPQVMPEQRAPKRTRGALDAAKSILYLMPPQFTKNHVFDGLREKNAELATRLKPDSLRGVMAGLVDGGLIEVVTPALGTRPAVYQLTAIGRDLASQVPLM